MKTLKTYITILLICFTIPSIAQTVDTLTIQSTIFNKARRVKVLLPKNYDKHPNTEEKYIVAYLFDAQSDNFFNFYSATVNYLTQQGYLNPLILVGVESWNRQFEFLPKSPTEEAAKTYRKTGGADSLAIHLRDELIPAIQKKYRTNGYNMGIGHSLGGTFVTYSLLKYPTLFNAAIAISPNYQYDNEYLVEQFDKLANTGILNHKFLYIAHGYGDKTEERFRLSSKKMESLLLKKNIPGLRWVFKSMDNDNHGQTPMEGIYKGLVAFNRQLTLNDVQIETFFKVTNKPFIESVKDYYRLASEWSGIKLPYLRDINLHGYNLLYDKRPNESKEFFTWGLSIYPHNLNLYDSMGEIQQESGDKAAALKYYTAGLNEIKNQKQTLESKRYDQLIAGFEKRITALDK